MRSGCHERCRLAGAQPVGFDQLLAVTVNVVQASRCPRSPAFCSRAWQQSRQCTHFTLWPGDLAKEQSST